MEGVDAWALVARPHWSSCHLQTLQTEGRWSWWLGVSHAECLFQVNYEVVHFPHHVDHHLDHHVDHHLDHPPATGWEHPGYGRQLTAQEMAYNAYL